MPRAIHEGRYRARATQAHFGVLPTEVPIPAEKRNVVPAIEPAGLAWYACTCVPQGERRAAESLRRERDGLRARGLPVLSAYVPCATDWVRRKRAMRDGPRTEIQTPIARSYVFVAAEGGLQPAHLHLMAERDHERRNRHGLTAILGMGRVPCPLGSKDIRFLARLAAAEREAGKVRTVDTTAYTAGDMVDVVNGPFSSFSGVVTGVDGERGRLCVEMSIFDRATPIELDFADVCRAA